MRDINWKDIMNKIKIDYEELSGSSKFVIILTALLIISNITINIWSGKAYERVELIIDKIINDETREILILFKVYNIISFMLESAKMLFFLFISIIAYNISLLAGKILGFFKSMTEFFNDIKEDPFFIKLLVIYDIIGIFFDIYTIYSLVTI